MWGYKIKIINRKSFLYLEIWIRDFCKTHTLAGTFNIFTGNYNLSSASCFWASVPICLSRKASGRQLTCETPNLTPPSTQRHLHPSAAPGQELTVPLSPGALRGKTATDNAIRSFPIPRQLWSRCACFVVYRTGEENPGVSETNLFLISKDLSFPCEDLCPSPLAPSPCWARWPARGYRVFSGCPW